MKREKQTLNDPMDKLCSKVRQLYAFLKEVNQAQFRPIRRLTEQQRVIRIAEMRKHPSAQLFRSIEHENSSKITYGSGAVARLPFLIGHYRSNAVFQAEFRTGIGSGVIKLVHVRQL